MQNKTIPDEILKEAMAALAHYPELKDVSIEFKFKKHLQKSFMQAQPKLTDIFKKERHYLVLMNWKLSIEHEQYSILNIPSDTLIGWLGHELGHLMDYRRKSGMGLIIFGLRYLTSYKFIRKAERAADIFAITHGMKDYILSTKNFILNHTGFSETYKKRIKRLYLSPEEIMQLIKKEE